MDGEVFVSSRLELIPTSSWREGVGKELREVTRSGGVRVGAEMEKRADTADISVLFFLWLCYFVWLYTRKPAKTLC